MKKLLATMFVDLLMVGCGGDTKKPTWVYSNVPRNQSFAVVRWVYNAALEQRNICNSA